MAVLSQLYFLNIFGLILIFGSTYCQIPSNGKCPTNVKSQQDFQLDQYLGKWFEYSKYPFIFEAGGKCITAQYDLNKSDNKTVTVFNSQINVITGKPSTILGTAELTNESGQLLVSFSSTVSFMGKSNYWVLGTDYTSYAVVYSCNNFFGDKFHTKVVWILTREQTPKAETIEAAKKVITDNELPTSFLFVTNQSNCPMN